MAYSTCKMVLMNDSQITTKVQRNLGKRLTEAPKPSDRLGAKRILHGVEVPVTASGLY